MPDRLNVLMITHKPQPETIPRSFAMARYLVARGHRVSVMLISPRRVWGIREYEKFGVHLIEFPDLLPGRLRTGWGLWDTANRIYYLSKVRGKYDLIHCFETRPVTIYPGLYFKRKQAIPMITDWNDWWGHHGLVDINRPKWYRYAPFGAIETFYEEAFRSKAEGLTVIATALRDRAIAMGVDPQKIIHISGGTFPEQVPVREKMVCRQHLGFPEKAILIGFGSANSHLDLEIVMAALLIIVKKFPSARLIMTGKPKPAIFRMAEKYDLKENILFTGFLSVEDYYYAIGAADVCLLPMADEPYNRGRWPNKMGDYLCVGRPTVSNPVGDILSLFEKHQVGLLADYHPEDFARQVIFLLDHPEVASTFGRIARQVAEDEYDWQILVDKLEAFYYHVCDIEISQEIMNQHYQKV